MDRPFFSSCLKKCDELVLLVFEMLILLNAKPTVIRYFGMKAFIFLCGQNLLGDRYFGKDLLFYAFNYVCLELF